MSKPAPDENPLTSIATAIAFSPMDWSSEHHRTAWVYGIVLGYDYPTEPGKPDLWQQVADKHGWDAANLARLKRLHAKYKAMSEPAKSVGGGAPAAPAVTLETGYAYKSRDGRIVDIEDKIVDPDNRDFGQFGGRFRDTNSFRRWPADGLLGGNHKHDLVSFHGTSPKPERKTTDSPSYIKYKTFMDGWNDARAGRLQKTLEGPYLDGFYAWGHAAFEYAKPHKGKCSHPEQFRLKGGNNERLPRMPLLYGSAEVEICSVCRGWHMNVHAPSEWRPGPYSAAWVQAKLDEEDRC